MEENLNANEDFLQEETIDNAQQEPVIDGDPGKKQPVSNEDSGWSVKREPKVMENPNPKPEGMDYQWNEQPKETKVKVGGSYQGSVEAQPTGKKYYEDTKGGPSQEELDQYGLSDLAIDDNEAEPSEIDKIISEQKKAFDEEKETFKSVATSYKTKYEAYERDIALAKNGKYEGNDLSRRRAELIKTFDKLSKDQEYLKGKEYTLARRELSNNVAKGNMGGALWNQFLSGGAQTVSGASGYLLDALDAIGTFGGNKNFANRFKESMKDEIRSAPIDIAGHSASEAYRLGKEKGFFEESLFGVAGSLVPMGATMLGGGPTPLFFQASDMADEEMKGMDLNSAEKTGIKLALAVPMAILENYGISNVMKGTGISKMILTNVLKKNPGKLTFGQLEKLLMTEAQGVGSQIARRGLSGFLAEAETGGLQSIAEISTKKLLNTLSERVDFETPETWGEIAKKITYDAAAEGMGGLIMSTPFAVHSALTKPDLIKQMTDKNFDLLSQLIKDPNTMDEIFNVLQKKVAAGEMSKEEYMQQAEAINYARGVLNMMPDNMTPAQQRDSFDLLSQKKNLTTEIEGLKDKDVALSAPAIQEREAKIAELDKKLITIAEGAVKGQNENSARPENSRNYANLTEDGNGNFVFYHVSEEARDQIQPSVGGKNTPRDEAAAISKAGGMAMYYTAQDKGEPQVQGKAKHMVKVPKDKVYDFNSDPENFIEEARARHEAENPGAAFDANSQFAYVTKIANENGYDMVVADWGKNGSRAQTTKAMTPSEVELTDGQAITQPFKSKYKSNESKGWKGVKPQGKTQKLKEFYKSIKEDMAPYGSPIYGIQKMEYYPFDDSFSPFKSQEEITKAVEESNLPESKKQEYRDIIASKEETSRSERAATQEQTANNEEAEFSLQEFFDFEKAIREDKVADVKKLVARAKNALAKIAPDVKFEIHNSEDSYAEATGEQNRSSKSAGEYNHDTRTIHINRSKANHRTVAHEVFHAILLNRVATDENAQVATKKMINELRGLVPANVQAKLDAFAENYDENVQDEEKLAEFVGMLAEGYVKMESKPKSIIERWIDNIAVALGIKNLSTAEMLSAIGTKVKKGEAIKKSDVRGIKKAKKTSESSKARKSLTELNSNIANALAFASESSIPNNLEFKRTLQERFSEDKSKIAKQYGIRNWSTKTKEALDNEPLKKYVEDAYVNETLVAMESFPDAIGWYDAKTKAAMSIMSLLHPEISNDKNARTTFTIALAVTSNGNKVFDNFKEANRQYEYFKKNGKFDEKNSIGTQSSGIKAAFKLANKILDKMSMTEFDSFLTSKFRAGDLKYTADDGSKKALLSGFGADTEVYGASIFGAKIGNGFFMNLNGQFDQLTMDRWFMRQFGRITGVLIDREPAKVKEAAARLKKAVSRLKKSEAQVLNELIPGFKSMGMLNLAKKINKVSAKKGPREAISVGNLDELRKAGNSLYGKDRGEIEAPNGAIQRTFIIEIFDRVQKRLKEEYGMDITIADLQAVNWYPEKALYQTFQSGRNIEDGSSETSDNEQPDYESAAAKLAKEKGFTEEQINNVKDTNYEGRIESNRESVRERASESNRDSGAASIEELTNKVLEVKANRKPDHVGKKTKRDKAWDDKTKAALPQSRFKTIADLTEAVMNGQWAMLTAENPNNTQVSDNANTRLAKESNAWLKDRGYKPMKIFGKYDNSENSLFVENMSLDHVNDFIKEFNQESVATDIGLMYAGGVMNPRVGSEIGVSQDNYYSTIKTKKEGHVDFAIDYDFKKTEKAPTKRKQLLAPNGKPSKLSQEQHQLVRTPEFKEWFGDWENDPKNASKVVDENGEPMVVYHGTNYSFDEFITNRGRGSGDAFNYLGDGHYFTNDYDVAESYADDDGNILEVFVRLVNPEMSQDYKHTNPATQGSFAKDLGVKTGEETKYLKSKGRDGVISKDPNENYTEVLAYESTQIKLADGSNKTFDPASPSIRKQDPGKDGSDWLKYVNPTDFFNVLDSINTNWQNQVDKINKTVTDSKNRAKKREESFKKMQSATIKEIRNYLKGFKSNKYLGSELASALAVASRATGPKTLAKAVERVKVIAAKAADRAFLSWAKKAVKKAENYHKKIGVNHKLRNMIDNLLDIPAKLIPNEVREDYRNVINQLNGTLGDLNDLMNSIEALQNAVAAIQEAVPVLSSLYAETYPDASPSDFGKNLNEMVEKGIISASDKDIMQKYKKDILEPAQATEKDPVEILRNKATKMAEELEKKLPDNLNEMTKEDLVDLIKKMIADDISRTKTRVLNYTHKNKHSQEMAVKFMDQLWKISDETLQSMSLTDLALIQKAVTYAKNGYINNVIANALSKVTGAIGAQKVDINSKKAAGMMNIASRLKSFISELMGGKVSNTPTYFKLMAIPKYHIDTFIGNVKNSDTYRYSGIYDMAYRLDRFHTQFSQVEKTLMEAENKLPKNPAKRFKSDIRIMLHMLQTEFESNPGNWEVKEAKDWVEATLNARHGEGAYSDKSKKIIEETLAENSTKDEDGNSTGDLANLKLTKEELAVVRAINKVNKMIEAQAEFAETVVRGNKFNPIVNHMHVVSKGNPDKVINTEKSVQQYSAPSARAGALKQRVKKATPISFDPVASAYNGARQVLFDFYMTQGIREMNETISRIIEDAENGSDPTALEIAYAIKNIMEETKKHILPSEFTETSFGDVLESAIIRKTYQATLAGVDRATAEFMSNMMYAFIADTDASMAGMNTLLDKKITREDLYNAIINSGTTQSSRLTSGTGIGSKKVETGMMQTGKIRQTKDAPHVLIAKTYLAPQFVSGITSRIDELSNWLLSAPDKVMGQVVYVGKLMTEFKKITGQDLDLKKLASDPEYKMKFRNEIQEASMKADQLLQNAASTQNAIEGVGKNQKAPSRGVAVNAYRVFDSFMTSFAIGEFSTSVKAIRSLTEDGEISKGEARKLLAATFTRMVAYMKIKGIIISGMISASAMALGTAEEPEDDESRWSPESFVKEILSAAVTLVLGRNGGNMYKNVVNYFVEYLNKEYGEGITREGEYNKYTNGMMYDKYSDLEDEADILNLVVGMSGGYQGIGKVALTGAKWGFSENQEEPKIGSANRVKKIREMEIEQTMRMRNFFLEMSKAAGIVPSPKDISSVMKNAIDAEYRDMWDKKNREKSRGSIDLESVKKKNPALYQKIKKQQDEEKERNKRFKKKLKKREPR